MLVTTDSSRHGILQGIATCSSIATIWQLVTPAHKGRKLFSAMGVFVRPPPVSLDALSFNPLVVVKQSTYPQHTHLCAKVLSSRRVATFCLRRIQTWDLEQTGLIYSLQQQQQQHQQPLSSLSWLSPLRSQGWLHRGSRRYSQKPCFSLEKGRREVDVSLSVVSDREAEEEDPASGACDGDDMVNRGESSGASGSSFLGIVEEEEAGAMECIGTGSDVECVVPLTDRESKVVGKFAGRAMKTSGWSGDMASSSDRGQTILDNNKNPEGVVQVSVIDMVLETLLLISPFFFWGTAMVAMKGVLPKAGPLFVASFRLIPAGTLLIAFASSRGRKMPVGTSAWLAITLFGLIDASCFQGFLTEGLRKTSAGLGSVIIDSQPLTVAVLAALLFGETLGPIAISGLGLGIVGLILLEVPPEVLQRVISVEGLNQLQQSVIVLGKSAEVGQWTLWDSGEWWMLLAAQSMAVGTVMVRWVCQYSDPIMATGWHMVLGGLPLLALSVWQQDPALSGHIQDLNINDWGALFYSSLFGSAISYGVFFYNATQGSLTKLSSLTFLTPMFATLFGYLVLDEMLSGVQLAGAVVTLVGIYMVNLKVGSETLDKLD